MLIFQEDFFSRPLASRLFCQLFTDRESTFHMCFRRKSGKINISRTFDTIIIFERKIAIFSKRQRITLRLLYAMSRPSVVCLSVTLVHPTQAVELFGNFFHHTIAQELYFSGAKNRWWGMPLSPWNLRSKWPTPLSNSEISTNIGS